MKVWIINPYANLPSEPWREDRSQVLAMSLAKRGDDVIVWTSNFIHRSKEYRSNGWMVMDYNERIKFCLLPVPSYTSHISLKRIYFERAFARQFGVNSVNFEKPDIIVLAEPALFYSHEIILFIEKFKVSLIVDIIDLWPELFHTILPKKIRWLGKYIYLPFYYKRNKLLKKASGIVAVTNNYLELCTRNFPNKPSMVVYWGTNLANSSHLEIEEKTVKKNDGDFWVLYAGTLGENYDIKSILKAAHYLKKDYPYIKFIILGNGSLREKLIKEIESFDLINVLFEGSIKQTQLKFYFEKADVALSTYVADSTVSMPIKAFDYLDFGIPIINSLEGDLGCLIRDSYVGIQYEAENWLCLAKSILKALNGREERQQMSENARKLAENFSNTTQYQRYLTFIDNIFYDS